MSKASGVALIGVVAEAEEVVDAPDASVSLGLLAPPGPQLSSAGMGFIANGATGGLVQAGSVEVVSAALAAGMPAERADVTNKTDADRKIDILRMCSPEYARDVQCRPGSVMNVKIISLSPQFNKSV